MSSHKIAQFCEKIYKNPPSKENSIHLQFSTCEIKKLFLLIKYIFLYGIVKKQNIGGNLTFEMFNEVSQYMKSFGIEVKIKIFTQSDIDYIFQDIDINLKNFNEKYAGDIRAIVGKKDKFMPTFTFFIRNKIYFKDINEICNRIINNIDNLIFLNNYSSIKRTKLKDFKIHFFHNDILYVVFFDFYIPDIKCKSRNN